MINVTHFSDPGCPFAYSASPSITALRWRYGDQLRWRHVMIGLTEDAEQYARRGYTTLRSARNQRRFRPFGMPFAHAPKQRLSATAPACRAVVAVRLTQPELEWAAFRGLQFAQFTTALPLESEEALRDGLRRVAGIDVDAILAMIDSPEVTEAYEADRAEARTAAGSPTEFQGKAENTDGLVRYTAPSLIFERDGRRLEAGGFQQFDAYDVCVANLDPSLSRRGAPDDLSELLAAFPEGVTAAEVAACIAPMTDLADPEAAELALLELADDGRAVVAPVGDGALWLSADSPFADVLAGREVRLGEPLPPAVPA
ncbi:MAG TPA: DsbA family protein [Solirubrobacteraceae bacterium]|jgi:2-hydroxychromene-2-carboxylate isomerase|nr:DsbA family protein [Solirubrobacteraceae bacterium]